MLDFNTILNHLNDIIDFEKIGDIFREFDTVIINLPSVFSFLDIKFINKNMILILIKFLIHLILILQILYFYYKLNKFKKLKLSDLSKIITKENNYEILASINFNNFNNKTTKDFINECINIMKDKNIPNFIKFTPLNIYSLTSVINLVLDIYKISKN